MEKQFSYNKQEKLKSRKTIEYLFSQGKSIFIFPVKMLYSFADDNSVALQAGVTASKRNFKKAVDRNRVKRVLREAYRLNKLPLQSLLADQEKSLAIFFIYTGKELPVYIEIELKMKLLLQKLVDNISDTTKIENNI